MDRRGKAAQFAVCAGLLAGAFGTPVAAGRPFTTIAVPGADQTFAVGINDSSEVVGYYAQGTNPVFGGPNIYGFTDIGGVFATVQDPSAVAGGTAVMGISNNGALVGDYTDSLGNTYGFLESGGVYTTLSDPQANPAYGTAPLGVNSQGEVVGYYLDASGGAHGFTWSDGAFTNFDAPGSIPGSTVGSGLTDSGAIFGDYYDTSGNPLGFADNGGVFTTLNDPQHPDDSQFNGVNDAGAVAGFWEDDAGYNHAFVESGGVYTDLDLGVLGSQAWGVNDEGEVVGFYKTSPDGAFNGFLTSVPEPGTWALMLVGMGLMGASLRRRSGSLLHSLRG